MVRIPVSWLYRNAYVLVKRSAPFEIDSPAFAATPCHVIDSVDHPRLLESPVERTPFLLFRYLDYAISSLKEITTVYTSYTLPFDRSSHKYSEKLSRVFQVCLQMSRF